MGNELSTPRKKLKGKIKSATLTPAGIITQHTPVTQDVQSPMTQGAKSQATKERNPTYQVTLDSSIYFFDTVRQISEATELLAPLKAVCGVIVKALETTRAVHANKDEWGNLVDKILNMQNTIEDQISRLQKDKHSHSPLTSDPAAVAPLRKLTMSLGEIFEASSDALKQSNNGSKTFNRILNIRIDAEKIQQYKEAVTTSFNEYLAAITLFTAHYTKEQGDIAAIRALKIVGNPGGNQHQTCTEDTRTHLLHDIRTWVDDFANEKQIFWISDRAGTGKSTVAKQIVTEWEMAAKPVVPFFFSIAAADTMSNAKFCSTVAVKLAELAGFGSFRTALAEVLRERLTMETLSFNNQFEKLIVGPLQTTNKRVLLVIDALDECDKTGRSELLATLLRNLDKLPTTKIMITSRPLPDINQKLHNQPAVYSRDLQGGGDPNSTTQDILHHLDHIFSNSHNLRHLQHHVPRLGKLANGLFIWASTAGRFLEESLDPDGALATIESMNGLDDLYTRIMECAIPKNDPHSRATVCFILQTILAAQRPLSVSELQTLMNKGKVVQSVVEALASVLSDSVQGKPVQILHPTFQEYLTDKDRSGIYFVDVNNGHNSLVLGCPEALSENLKDLKTLINEEIPDLRSNPDQHWRSTQESLDGNALTITATSRTTASIPSTLAYAATFWPKHAIASLTKGKGREEIEILEENILYLFKNHLIQWFELVVLLQGVYLCIKNLAALEKSIPVSPSTTGSLTEKTSERAHWCRDGHRYLQYHQVGIEQGSIYVHRALGFTPKESLTHKYYYNKYDDRIPSVKCGIPSDWPSYQVLSGHISSVICVAFSPDGTRLISGSLDDTIRLWDGVTGASIGDPMKGHTDYVTCVAFSSNGTRVVSGSADNTLRLWDGVTGAAIGNLMKGHTSDVGSVAFSPDGTRIVLGSLDNTIRLWDSVTSANIGDPMEEHISYVTCVAFSPDGTRVVSGSDDYTLRLWNSSSCVQQAVIETGSIVYRVHFSTCGSHLFSEGQIWDIVRFNSTNHTLENFGYSKLVFPLPNYQVTEWAAYKSRIVLGSEDGTVMLVDCTHLM